MLNFITAIFWGQLSKCQKLTYSVAQYSCSNRVAYAAVCAFAILMFLAQFTFTTFTILWRGDLINEVGLYDDISSSSNPLGAHAPYDNIPSSSKSGSGFGGSASSPPPSADL